MIISDKYKILGVHIPKTGMTSIKQLIKQNDPKSIEYRNFHAWIRPEDYKKYKNYFKFVIVRNSWKSCSSCWKFETMNPRPKFNDRRGMDFPTWLEWKNKCQEIDHEYYPKQLPFFMHDGKILVDKIIDFDNLENEINILCKKYKWKGNIKNFKSHYYGKYDWKKPYNNINNIKLVEDICKEDINYFGFIYK